MKAIVYTQHGGREVVRMQEMSTPFVGPGEVLVRVRAAALNHIDLWVRQGLPRLRLSFPHIPGADAAGVVESVGAAVTRVRPGEEVMLSPGVSCGVCQYCVAGQDNLCDRNSILGEHRHGTYAEFVSVPEANILPKPSHLTFEDAASMPLVFLTAWNMLVTNARLRVGETVLIWGAGSGVGSAGIQIAKLFGARVIVVAGSRWKVDKAAALGADAGIDYGEADVLEEVRRLTGKRGVDVVFDHVGAATWQTSIKALMKGGRLVTCGATAGAEAPTDLRYVFGRRLSIYGTWMGSKGELYDLMRAVEAGRLRPVVYQVFPWEEAVHAQDVMERSEHFGKLVLTVT
ncbi:MAG TPA: zinc-binding dehydrogenase, partial [bacterium]|nr:zinc-binding dehydrogenase [bacterium]